MVKIVQVIKMIKMVKQVSEIKRFWHRLMHLGWGTMRKNSSREGHQLYQDLDKSVVGEVYKHKRVVYFEHFYKETKFQKELIFCFPPLNYFFQQVNFLSPFKYFVSKKFILGWMFYFFIPSKHFLFFKNYFWGGHLIFLLIQIDTAVVVSLVIMIVRSVCPYIHLPILKNKKINISMTYLLSISNVNFFQEISGS